MNARLNAPVEVAVVEFPGDRFNVEIVPALAQLVDDGVVTILDLVFVRKDASGATSILEFADLDDDTAAAFEDLDGDVNGLLTEDDCQTVAHAMRPNTSAAILVWENAWARSLRQLVNDAGGRLVALDRLDQATVQAAMSRT
jgi:hypothetical protein